VGDLGSAFQIAGGPGNDKLIAQGFTFTADQRTAIFATSSIETIIDPSGTYTAPPTPPGVFTLTPGADTFVGGAGNNTVYGTAATLSAGDSLTGGSGMNVLELIGSGSFDITQLATFTGFQRITLNNPTIYYASLVLNGQPIEIDATGYLQIYVTSPSNWNGGDIIKGDASYSFDSSYLYFYNLTPSSPVTYDLTSAALSRVNISGSGSSLTLLINNSVAAAAQYLSGFGTNDQLVTSEATLDLSQTRVSGFAVVSTNTQGTTFTVGDLGSAFQIAGGPGNDKLIAQGFTFTADQRTAIFATSSIETIIDPSGTYTALPTTVIEAFGSTSLVQVGSNYFLYPVGGSSGPQLKYADGTTPVVAGQTSNWVPLGAEQTIGGYQIAWKLAGADQYTIWNTDSSGTNRASPVGVVSGSSAAFEAFETTFQQDLNGDGVIGTVIEAYGSARLVQTGSSYFLDPVAGSSGPQLKYMNGTPVVAGQTGNWVPLGAEQTASGYEVAWKLAGSDQYTVWNTDAGGANRSSPIGIVSGSSAALEALEPSFNQDLNGDGVIGIATPTVIEAYGSTSLVQVGNYYFLYPKGGSSGPLLKYANGTPVVAGQTGNWVPLGAEQTASGYQVAWKLAGADQYTVWNTDASGANASSPIGIVSGSSTALEAFETTFQQDLNGDGVIGGPGSIPPSGQIVLFSGQNASGNNGLWVTDGTAAGTYELIGIGGASPLGLNPSSIANVNGKALFAGLDAEGNHGLWVTNATTAGTYELTGINSTAVQGSFTALNGEVLFSGNGGSNGEGLWVTDGTAAGTHQLTGIAGAYRGSALQIANGMTLFKGEVLFAGLDENQRYGLWISDGTVTGTHAVTGITGASLNNFEPQNLTVFNNEVLFGAYDATGHYNLWVTDGTASGTHELSGISGASSQGLNPSWFTPFNGVVLFTGTDARNGTPDELWLTDGTAAGTREITGVSGESHYGLGPQFLTVFKDQVFFDGFDAAGIEGLWRTDGTAAGTYELTGIAGAYAGGLLAGRGNFAVLGDKLLFEGRNASGNFGLWETDGTAAGTHELTDISGACASGLGASGWLGLTPVNIADVHALPVTVIEAFGSTKLFQIGNYYFLYAADGSSAPLLKYANGTPVLAGQTGNWVPLGAEQSASGYEVAWKLADADQYTVWSTDGSGANRSSPIGIVSGSSTALEAIEHSFKQDLNGDGVIGIPSILPLPPTVLTYDVLKDFNVSGRQPASGDPFTYGTETSLNVGFKLLPYFSNTNSSVGGGPSITNDGTVNNYYFAQPLQFSGPTVAAVATGNTLTFPSAVPEIVPNDVLVMEPGSPGFNAPDLTVTRFTAPSAGTFDIAGSFADLQKASVDLKIVIDGKTVFSSSFSGQSPYQGTIPFSIAGISLQAGQTIDFVVDSLGSQFFDVVGLKALITETLSSGLTPLYAYTSINAPLANNLAFAQGINNAGQIVGWYQDSSGNNHGFLYTGGTYTALDCPLATNTTAQAINDQGEIVGSYTGQDHVSHSFLYSNGSYTTLGGPLGAVSFTVTGINDLDEIVGNYTDSSGYYHGFLYAGGTYTTLDDPYITAGSVASGTSITGINNAGQIAGNYYSDTTGRHGFLYYQGTYITLDIPLAGSVGGAEGTYASGINNLGEIVGSYFDQMQFAHSFLYSNGSYEIFDEPLATISAGNGTFAAGINDKGQITGFYSTGSYTVSGFLANSFMIGAGETLQVTSALSDQVSFTASTGILELLKSSNFSGTVAGMTGNDAVDFDAIDPTKVQAPSYSGDASGGTLTVTDGSHDAHIALLGNYLASTFVASSDGHGGTMVVDPVLPASSTLPSLAPAQH
jgi:probable HAF family extracellular repeat protein/ELWxxDGT repeat protein